MLVDWVRVRQKPGWLGAVSGDWTHPGNWGIDGVPGPGWNAVFNGPTPRPGVTLTTNIYCQSLYFDNANCPAFTLQSAGSQLHLGAGPAGIGAITISSTVTNSQTIGVDVVADRPVQFGNFARGASPALILNGRIDALSNDCSLQLCGFSPVQVNGALSSRIGRVIKWGSNRAWLAGTNAHSGPTDVVQGTLVVASPSALGQTGAEADTTVNSGSSLLFAPGTDYLLPETLHVSGAGRSGNGVLDLESAGVAQFAGTVILDTNATLSCTPAGGTLRLAGEISGSAELVKSGAGTLELSASNSLTGPVRVRAGSLLVRHRQALGIPDERTVVENTGRLQLAGEISLGEPLDLQGAVSGHLHLENLAGTNNILTAVSLIGGGYDYGIAARAGLLSLFGGVAFTDIYGTLRTLELSGDGAGAISGPILDGASAPVAVRIAGPGKWRLAGTNGYSGGTVVAGGTCLLTGTLRSEVVVSNGTFSGTGVISNRLVVAGGLHLPGSPVGIQTIRGPYTLSSAGSVRFQLNAPGPAGQSAVSVQNGSVSLGGALQVDAPPSLATNTTFLVVDNDGTDPVIGTFAGLAEGATFFAAGYGWKVSYVGGTGNDVSLTVISRTRPTVSAAPSGPGLNLSWPEWAADYQLRAATNLSPPVFWSLVTNLITVSNGTLSTLVPMDGPQRFFRLEFP
jgi:autotransporter-associated beta strand protein